MYTRIEIWPGSATMRNMKPRVALGIVSFASLKGEATEVQAEISRLLEEMSSAISQADKFISTLQ